MYATVIHGVLARRGRTDVAPRLVEAQLRLMSPTGRLDHLPFAEFEAEVGIALARIDESPEAAESVAQSWAL